MSTASDLPPDIQKKLDASRRGPAGGIGARAAENSQAARARAVAMGEPVDDQESVADAIKAAAHPETLDDPPLEACPRCSAKADEQSNFCNKCGMDLMRGDFGARIGVEFDEKDIEDYVFRGFVMRDLKIYGNHTITVKSSQPTDSRDVDDHQMNGDWRKEKDGKTPKPTSDFMIRDQYNLALTATLVLKFDGKSIGDTVKDRIKWLESHGSALVDTLAKRAIWFNRALTAHLQKADVLEGF